MFLQERELTLEDPIARALVYLADCCDGATSKDRKGFNGYDSSWGKALAAEIREGHTLTPKERWDAFHKLKKHKRQLEQAGIQLPDRVSEPFAVQRDGDLFYVENLLKNSRHTVFTDGYAAGYCSCEAHSKWGRWCDHLEHVRSILLRDPKVIELLSFAPACEPVKRCEAMGEPVVNLLPSLKPLQDADCEACEPDDAEKAEIPRFSKHAEGLSANQLEAFWKAIDWYDAYGDASTMPFVLKGYAGVGKSFVIQRIVMELKDRYPRLKVALCAPTHQARHILEGMAHRAGLDDVTISTLHSLCHVMPGDYTADGKQRLKVNKDSGSAYYTDFDLVVIDEGSMVGMELMLHVPFERRPTIFMGDPAQLPPVETDVLDENDLEVLRAKLAATGMGNEDIEKSLSGKESPAFSIPNGIELTQVMRYEGAIAEYVTKVRNSIESRTPPTLRTSGNIQKMKEDEWMRAMIDGFKQFDNPHQIRALAWTNKRVVEINGIVRASIYPDADQAYIKGERLMAKEPIIIKEVTYSGATRPKIAMYSCAECVVTDVAIGYENITGHEELQKVKIYHMEVTTDLGESLSLRRIHEDDWLRVEDFFKSFKKWILDLHPSERRSFWKDFYRLQEDFTLTIKGNKLLPRLQYAYAVTVHQSQGSTFNNVYADYSNIMGCAQDPKMRNQLLYVACSRASENLFLRSKF